MYKITWILLLAYGITIFNTPLNGPGFYHVSAIQSVNSFKQIQPVKSFKQVSNSTGGNGTGGGGGGAAPTTKPGGGGGGGGGGTPTKTPSSGSVKLDEKKGGDVQKQIKSEINKISCKACGPDAKKFSTDADTCKNGKVFSDCAKSKCKTKVDALNKLIEKCPKAGSTGSTTVPGPLAVLLATMAAALVTSMA